MELKTIKTLRDLRGNRTRNEVASLCGISIDVFAEYEDGTRVPRDEVKRRLAECYGVGCVDVLNAIRETLKENDSNSFLTSKDTDFVQMNCYRLDSLLRQTERLIEGDEEDVEDAHMLIQSARVLLWDVTKIIETVSGFGEHEDADRPADL